MKNLKLFKPSTLNDSPKYSYAEIIKNYSIIVNKLSIG